MNLASGHLLGIETLEPREITTILDAAETFAEISTREIKKVPALRGKTVVNFFVEPSTRTRSSFELAEKRLSADSLNFSTSTSSLVKGETLLDTAKNLEAMAPDFIVIRHSEPGAPHFLARHCRSAIINAGDGAHEHPTQALLDAFTIRQRKGRLKGLRVAIVGDILHSRVARSNIFLLTRMGAEVTACGPPTLIPRDAGRLGCAVTHRMEEAVEGADVVMMLRIQLERMQGGFFPTLREYAHLYGLDETRLARAASGAIVMHPGPINRGVEIMGEVADGSASVILDQVTNETFSTLPMMFLYHVNLGFPLLDEGTRILASCNSVSGIDPASQAHVARIGTIHAPAAEVPELVFLLDMKPDREGYCSIVLHNRSIDAGAGLGIFLRYRKNDFPYFHIWKRLTRREYVVGFEPGICTVQGRVRQRERGDLRLMGPQETVRFALEMGVLTSNEEIDRFAENQGLRPL